MEPIRVHALSQADAACVADAARILPGEVLVHGGEAIVDVAVAGDRDRALVELLDVLQSCLDENGVESVRVEVEGRTYTLRGPAGDGGGRRMRVISVGPR